MAFGVKVVNADRVNVIRILEQKMLKIGAVDEGKPAKAAQIIALLQQCLVFLPHVLKPGRTRFPWAKKVCLAEH